MAKLRSMEKRLLKEAVERRLISEKERDILGKGGFIERKYLAQPTPKELEEHKNAPEDTAAPEPKLETVQLNSIKVIEQIKLLKREEKNRKKQGNAPIKTSEFHNFLQHYQQMQQTLLAVSGTVQAVVALLIDKFDWLTQDIIEEKVIELHEEAQKKHAADMADRKEVRAEAERRAKESANKKVEEAPIINEVTPENGC